MNFDFQGHGQHEQKVQAEVIVKLFVVDSQVDVAVIGWSFELIIIFRRNEPGFVP